MRGTRIGLGLAIVLAGGLAACGSPTAAAPSVRGVALSHINWPSKGETIRYRTTYNMAFTMKNPVAGAPLVHMDDAMTGTLVVTVRPAGANRAVVTMITEDMAARQGSQAPVPMAALDGVGSRFFVTRDAQVSASSVVGGQHLGSTTLHQLQALFGSFRSEQSVFLSGAPAAVERGQKWTSHKTLNLLGHVETLTLTNTYEGPRSNGLLVSEDGTVKMDMGGSFPASATGTFTRTVILEPQAHFVRSMSGNENLHIAVSSSSSGQNLSGSMKVQFVLTEIP